MRMRPSIPHHIISIGELAKNYGVVRLEVSRSAMTEEFDIAKSDVDFIVHYPEGYKFISFLKRYLDLGEEISEALQRPAPLVMTSALKARSISTECKKTRTLTYGRPAPDQGDERPEWWTAS